MNTRPLEKMALQMLNFELAHHSGGQQTERFLPKHSSEIQSIMLETQFTTVLVPGLSRCRKMNSFEKNVDRHKERVKFAKNGIEHVGNSHGGQSKRINVVHRFQPRPGVGFRRDWL
ncbi:hypothetical protein WG66_012012 [Moniliophthora roreri]|nr:hypothetical protein WG66_012012 [Moniliophthora roreri]